MTDCTLLSILFVGWSKIWKRPPLQKKHNADETLVLLWKPYSWCSPWFNFNICLGDISTIHFSYLPQVSRWSISGKLCYWFLLVLESPHLAPQDRPFHRGESLSGTLQVLYRFPYYHSKFDCENKGLSLFGHVSLASLPEIASKSTHS
jgi:hypothetical protein